MNLENFKKNLKIERVLQLTAHPTYIVLGVLYFYGYQRPLYFYPLLMFFVYLFFFLFISFANKILPAESIAYMTVQMVFGFIYFKIPNLKNSKI